MRSVYQQGSSTLLAVAVFFTLSLFLLMGLHHQLNRAMRITQDQQFYLRAYNQAASSLNWGLSHSWPLRLLQHSSTGQRGKWHCAIQQPHGLKACIKAMITSGTFWLKGESALLKGEGSLTGHKPRKIVLYQQVIYETTHSAVMDIRKRNMPKMNEQRVMKVTNRWLDFCPEKDEEFCVD
ncbi:YgdB family protein [Candidatus Fukatsuia symbiotica]|uniref:DUF2509 domain-containing protein n=1 Tax=Candidatus Fukatsuia symbiotica TaxID=1878942 RepID=A0A2U8I9U2_9GAMM|nr:YgdB family protein [Candidatus Fukatsuia symbiotica]AWK14814.1 hypothetical protein CCS41_10580 [Candidatus Fukatsuia symbiotica]MEA9445153.1 YgdB family protein [Candidatus Fukatsuia symbiotica]